MADNCLQLLTKNNELVESRALFSSYVNSDKKFDRCFLEMYGVDYRLIFGDQSREVFLFKLLKNYYQNDFFIRYSFINKVLSKTKAVFFEEFAVSDSRIDLASINGKSVAYEIKTEFDNYKKLKKQIIDYSKAFEYVYVICPKDKAEKVKKEIPTYCGVYLYYGKTTVFFEKHREATVSPNLNTTVMIGLLKKNELLSSFETDVIGDIVKIYHSDYIDLVFKKSLKKRFKERWLDIKKRALYLK